MRGPFLVVNMGVSWAWFVAFAVAWLSAFSSLTYVDAQRKFRVGILLNAKRALGAKVAVELVNLGGSDILTGVQVEYVINHTQNNRYIALEAARWQIEVFKAKAIVGPEFSSVAAVVAPYCKDGISRYVARQSLVQLSEGIQLDQSEHCAQQR